MYLSKQMSKNSQILNRGYNTLSEVGAPEYGIYDKANYLEELLLPLITYILSYII